MTKLTPGVLTPRRGGVMEIVKFKGWVVGKLPIGSAWFRHCVASLDHVGVVVKNMAFWRSI